MIPAGFPIPISAKALFATDVVRPDPSELIVDVPANFVATASGEPRGTHKAGGETEFRFLLHKDDFDPYVVSGAYQQQTITTADGTVVIWTFKPIPAAQAQQTGAQVATAAKFYARTFGPLPKNMRTFTVADIETSSASPFVGVLPGIVFNLVLPDQSASRLGSPPIPQVPELDVAYTWFGHMIVPRAEPWMLRDSLTSYAAQLQNEGSNAGRTRKDRIISSLEHYDDERAKAEEKPIAFLTASDPEDQQQIGGDKIQLFFFALEDKCGRENVERAMAHMVYALRGQEYGYNDFRVALEQECHQDLLGMFATWLDQTGIPADFRARYENATSK